MAFERLINVIDRPAVKAFWPRARGEDNAPKTYPRYSEMVEAAREEAQGAAVWARWSPGMQSPGGDGLLQVDVALATAAAWGAVVPTPDIELSGTPARQTVASGSTDVVLTNPGVTEGNTVLAYFTLCAGSGADWPTIGPPAGFSLVRSVGTTDFTRCSVYRKAAGASEGADYTFTLTGGTLFATSSEAGILAYGAGAAVLDVDASDIQENAASNNVTCKSVTATVEDTMLVCFFAGTDGNTAPPTITEAASMTRRLQKVTASDYALTTVADEAIAAAGPTGTRVGTFGLGASAISRCITVLLKKP